MYNSVADYTIISDMSSEEFDRIVFSELPPIVFEVLNNYCKERGTDGAYCSGIFIYTRYDRWSQDVYLTFFNSPGEHNSLRLMLDLGEEVGTLFEDRLIDKFHYYGISKAITSWKHEDCDMISKSAYLADKGIVVQNGETKDTSIWPVMNGKRTTYLTDTGEFVLSS